MRSGDFPVPIAPAAGQDMLVGGTRAQIGPSTLHPVVGFPSDDRRRFRSLVRASWMLVAVGASAVGDDRPVADAIRTGLALVEKAARNWPEHRDCFSCHHQTLPLFAVREAERHGFAPDEAWADAVVDFSHVFFTRRKERLRGAEHIAGGAFTAGYTLWAFALDDRPPDDTTAALATYLLRTQGVARPEDLLPERAHRLREGPWLPSCRRPPLQRSEIAATVLALEGLQRYATDEQQERFASARLKAESWLAAAPLVSQEDFVWRLWGLHYLGGDPDLTAAVRSQLVAAQQSSGGWSQEPGLNSDAYSTGQALYILRLTGSPRDDAVIQRAVGYLLSTRCDDGSWRVETRVQPVQTYFDNGDPHGEHQFLSTAATCWAIAGLAQVLPESHVVSAHAASPAVESVPEVAPIATEIAP